MVQRIAIASIDGQNIDLHFAQAAQYYIYDLQGSGHMFVEVRQVPPIINHGGDAFDRVLACLQDCTAIFVSRIGLGAARYLASKGLRIFEAPYPITAVLDKLTAKQILHSELR